MSEERIRLAREATRARGMDTPTPARSEAAGGVEASASEAALRSMLAWQHEHGESLTMSVRQCPVSAQDIRNVLAELASLRQQLAAAREDGERLDWLESVYCERYGAGLWLREWVAARASTLRGAIDSRRHEDAARSEPSGEGETCGTMPPVRVTPIRRGKPMPYDVPDDEPGGEDSQC